MAGEDNNMKHIKYLNTLDEVRALVSKVQEKRIPGILGLESLKHFFYRGQISDSFELKSSLSRFFIDSKRLAKVEEELMIAFKAEMIAKGKFGKVMLHDPSMDFQNEWAWLGQAQHYRLPTRMLDWTLSWEVALFFAVENNPTYNDHDSQFWVFSVPEAIVMHDTKPELYYRTDPYRIDQTWLINPSFFWTDNNKNETAETRRARMHGKFLIQSLENTLKPLEDQADIIPNIEKYCIPKGAKGQIRLELAADGIYGEFLYCNEDDVINDLIYNLRNKFNLT